MAWAQLLSSRERLVRLDSATSAWLCDSAPRRTRASAARRAFVGANCAHRVGHLASAQCLLSLVVPLTVRVLWRGQPWS